MKATDDSAHGLSGDRVVCQDDFGKLVLPKTPVDAVEDEWPADRLHEAREQRHGRPLEPSDASGTQAAPQLVFSLRRPAGTGAVLDVIRARRRLEDVFAGPGIVRRVA